MEEYLVIKKSNLKPANIHISGYRHASNLLIAAALVPGVSKILIDNVPDVIDTQIMIKILTGLGIRTTYNGNRLEICSTHIFDYNVPCELSEKIHGSIYLLPALLARCKKVSFGKSGGCLIGDAQAEHARPSHHILSVMEKFGASITKNDDIIFAQADSIHGQTVDILDYSDARDELKGPLTSGATKTAIILALAAKTGRTIILNPFLKSEVIDLLEFIKQIGYKVSYDNQKIEIEYAHINELVQFHVVSDPAEIITYITLAVYHNIEIELQNITSDKIIPILQPELHLLKELGIKLVHAGATIIILPNSDVQAKDIHITPMGVCTDHHPFIALILLKAKEQSSITEHVWYDRFNYLKELNKFNLELVKKGNTVFIKPKQPEPTTGLIFCPDLRAAAIIVILAMEINGTTKIANFHHLYRGYHNFLDTLQTMGACLSIEPLLHAGVG